MTNLVANDHEDEMEKVENSICPGRGMVCCHCITMQMLKNSLSPY